MTLNNLQQCRNCRHYFNAERFLTDETAITGHCELTKVAVSKGETCILFEKQEPTKQ